MLGLSAVSNSSTVRAGWAPLYVAGSFVLFDIGRIETWGLTGANYPFVNSEGV